MGIIILYHFYMKQNLQFKDEILNGIAERGGNVAQFASFAPDGTRRFARIRGVNPAQKPSITEAVRAILGTGVSYLTIRSFRPEKMDGNPFFLGNKDFARPEQVIAKPTNLSNRGFTSSLMKLLTSTTAVSRAFFWATRLNSPRATRRGALKNQDVPRFRGSPC
jgi:hypothetical protein